MFERFGHASIRIETKESRFVYRKHSESAPRLDLGGESRKLYCSFDPLSTETGRAANPDVSTGVAKLPASGTARSGTPGEHGRAGTVQPFPTRDNARGDRNRCAAVVQVLSSKQEASGLDPEAGSQLTQWLVA